MNSRLIIFLATIFLASCTSKHIQIDKITDVYVTDFGSEEPDRCRPSDVDLSHHEARKFFLRARQVNHKVIHDYYDYAPCYIVGTLKYKSKICEWEIRAGATGHIKCNRDTLYYVCDTCDDLFQSE